MTGHRPFTELTKGFTPERRARAAARAAAMREMTPEELRKARDLSQESMAAALELHHAGNAASGANRGR